MAYTIDIIDFIGQFITHVLDAYNPNACDVLQTYYCYTHHKQLLHCFSVDLVEPRSGDRPTCKLYAD